MVTRVGITIRASQVEAAGQALFGTGLDHMDP